jgi:ABC-type lipoprotein export system ATPase subunit/ABC-type antimicrobial peptide transport system permease subunit
MITIKGIHKYFNKGKRNELHVINNTTLTLNDTGLVAILGPSGCGKTTLLNAIGGLDKVNKGNIYINGKKITSKCNYKVDKIRNLNIGYIFQDYKLIDNMSVYDNVALVLTMIGLKDEKEIKKRVEYVLDKVGMLRFQKRPAGMLSGGERQRVGIARAIVKNPNIILADEPTGNLDSKNSLEIMKIIKAISKDRLVILVTHEQTLAKFYATRIIEVKDGTVISDKENNHADELDYNIDNRFYLKDFKKQKKLDNIKIYSDEEDNVALDIVVVGNNIYIKSKKKIEVVDENSSIEFIDDHYKKIATSEIEQYQFNFKDIINDSFKKKYSSIFNPLKVLLNGFKKLFDFPILKKILLIGFLLSGMFIMYSISTITATLQIREEDFVTRNKEYLSIISNKVSLEDFSKYESLDGIEYVLPGDSTVTFNVNYNEYYQTSLVNDSLNGSLSSISMINSEDLIYGTMPTNSYEIVVDKLSIQKMFDNSINMAKMAGIVEIKDMIGKHVSVNNMDDFIIVGIVDLKSPSIYIDENLFINIIANSSENQYDSEYTNIIDYTLYENKIELKEGRMPINDYEVIVNISNKDDMKLNKEIDIKVGDKKLTVVGYYTTNYDYQYYFTNNNTIKYNTILSKSNVTVYSSNKEETLNTLRNMNLNVKNSYDQDKKDYLNSMKESTNATLIFSGVILLISFIEIFLMIRSSFLSRIKEIGIYRAIGVKKSDIYKMFFGEIFAITTISSVPGVLFMAYALKTLSSVKFLSQTFIINYKIVILSIICIYIFNLIIGLIPVFNTIRKRPAEILSRHDLD